MSRVTSYRWRWTFVEGRKKVEDETTSGCPLRSRNEIMVSTVFATVREHQEDLLIPLIFHLAVSGLLYNGFGYNSSVLYIYFTPTHIPTKGKLWCNVPENARTIQREENYFLYNIVPGFFLHFSLWPNYKTVRSQWKTPSFPTTEKQNLIKVFSVSSW